MIKVSHESAHLLLCYYVIILCLKVIGYVEDWFENEGANDGAKDDQNPLEITDNFFRDRDQDKDGFVSVNEFPGNKRDEL